MSKLLLIVCAVAACSRPPATTAPAAPATPAPAGESGTAAPLAEPPLPEPNRPLTEGERVLLRPIFRDGVDYDAVRVVDAAFPFQPRGVYMTPRGHVYAPGPLFRDDFSTASAEERAIFVHELTHVWQFTNGIDLVAEGVAAFAKYGGRYERAYPYTLAAERDLADYGMEQQASIVEDYYRVAIARAAPQRIENRNLSPADRDALYASVLRRFLADARYVRGVSAAELAKRHAAAEPPAAPTTHRGPQLCSWRFAGRTPE